MFANGGGTEPPLRSPPLNPPVRHRFSLPLLALLALPFLSSLSFADLVTGRIVGANGVGVPGINIDAFRVSNGNEENNIFNDGTDANGNFSTTIPAGLYDLHFLPPGPPTTTHVPLVVRNVVISGTRALGTLTLEAGVALSGHLQTQAGTPVANVSLQLFDLASGFQIPETQDKSNAFGNFSLAAPLRPVELRLVTTGLLTPVLVSQRMTLTPVATVNLGNITLQDGFVVSGHVQRTVGGTAVTGLDLDFIDQSTGAELWTPNDSTNALGNFATIVPAGTFDLELCPTIATRLVARRLTATVGAPLDLGLISLDTGFLLSGTVRSFAGIAQAGADLDVGVAGLGKVLTCNDNTNATGGYSVVVPGGTLRVIFHPPSYTLGLGTQVVRNVVVSADRVLDGVLPACDPATNYGTGLAGTGGVVPSLAMAGGVATLDNPNHAFQISGGRGGATGFLMIGFGSASVPVLGGTLLVAPTNAVFAPIALGGAAGQAGAGSLSMPTQIVPDLIGARFYCQAFIRDPLAVQGWSITNATTFEVCR